MGVKGIELSDDDKVVGFAMTEAERSYVLAVCAKGYGKRTHVDEFRKQNRGGKGIILIDASDRNGPVVDLKLVKLGDEVMVMTDRGQTLRTRVDEIRETGRNAQGVKIMSVEGEERIVAVERMAEATESEVIDAVLGDSPDGVTPASLLPDGGDGGGGEPGDLN